ncbi:hypothetical protein OUZ56_017476 [Daphnia magna]|uniref:Uncharacterized protein n=1 Tax=Daphnia magna TaxID=35525 RepID=A0ABR0ASX3_9CRUS|nr:hypothetical protein OUZ56_017476 [Daphnia magna]
MATGGIVIYLTVVFNGECNVSIGRDWRVLLLIVVDRYLISGAVTCRVNVYGYIPSSCCTCPLCTLNMPEASGV